MGLGLFLAGGLLQGAGGGIVKKAEQSAQERRDAALSKMRMDEDVASNKLLADREAQTSARNLSSQLTVQRDAQGFTAQMGAAGAKAKADERSYEASQAAEERAFKAKQAALNRAAELELKYGGAPVESHTNEATGDVTQVFYDTKTKKRYTETIKGVAVQVPRAAEKTGVSDLLTPKVGKEPKYVSQADIAALAKSRGMTTDQAEAFAKTQGFTVR